MHFAGTAQLILRGKKQEEHILYLSVFLFFFFFFLFKRIHPGKLVHTLNTAEVEAWSAQLESTCCTNALTLCDPAEGPASGLSGPASRARR